MRVLRSTAIMLCLATQVAGDGPTCGDPLLSISGGDAATRARTCTVASDARARLRSCGVPIDRLIEIAIVESFEEIYSSCRGLYHCGEDRIEILTPEGLSMARAGRGAFVLISDEAYWDSILVHELTHAAYDAVHCPLPSCLATDEYAAYAMQVFLMPEDQRNLFGKTVDVQSKPSRDAISAVMLAFSPDRFAKLTWLHISDQDDPCNHMGRIMQGKIFFDREPL